MTDTTKRKTIGLLTAPPGSPFPTEKWLVWRGIWDRVQYHQGNLIYLAGHDPHQSPEAVVYDLLKHQHLDALIAWDAFTTYNYPKEEVSAFLTQFSEIPLVTIERDLPEFSSVTLDNRSGIDQLVEHLVDFHHLERVGFVSHSTIPLALDRQRYFEEKMTSLGLYDPSLVGGLEEIRARGKKPVVDYDALIALTDTEAIHLIQALQEEGFDIPRDVAVCGFNDGLEARGSVPALTSVRIPLYEMAGKAVDMVMEEVEGSAKPGRNELFPVSLLVRQSCGCLEPMADFVVRRTPYWRGTKQGIPLDEWRERLLRELRPAMNTRLSSQGRDWANELLDIIVAEFQKASGKDPQVSTTNILRDFHRLLIDAHADGINISRWHNGITILSKRIVTSPLEVTSSLVSSLMHQLRVMLSQMVMRLSIHQNWELNRQYRVLREMEIRFIGMESLAALRSSVHDGMRELGILDYCLITDLPSKQDELAVFQGGIDGEEAEIAVKPGDWLPESLIQKGEPICLVVQALHANEQQYGFLVTRSEPPITPLASEIVHQLAVDVSNMIRSFQLREELVMALKAADEANQLKSSFLSTVSHELRTPLSNIVGLSELTLRSFRKEPNRPESDLDRYLRQIMLSGQHLDRLIRDVLDLTSSQSGFLRIDKKPVDIRHELMMAAEMGQQMAKQKNLGFQVNIPDSLPFVEGDPTRIRQIILNLLSNAVKFTSDGEVGLSAEAVGNEVHFHVRDTGLGIRLEDQQRIFGEFLQVNPSETRGKEGWGLGLAVTRQLVEMHQGSISVFSKGVRGSGSEFSVSLPASQDQPEDGARGATDTRRLVLILSDRQGGKTIEHELHNRGFRVAMRSLDEHLYVEDRLDGPLPGAIVIDLKPEFEQSWDVVSRIKDSPAMAEVPVLFYSMVQGEDRGGVYELNILQKPIQADQLNRILEFNGMRLSRYTRYTILLIDDDPSYFDLAHTIIHDLMPASTLLTATSQDEAFELLKTQQVSLILIDLMVPGINNDPLVRLIQTHPLYKSIPIVFLTGQALKPVEVKELGAGVATVLNNNQTSSDQMIDQLDTYLSRNPSLGSNAQRMVYQAVAFIQDHFNQPISRGDIAAHVNVNEQYLSRCFTRELDISPISYLNRYRLDTAQALLSEKKLSITKISEMVGYSSQSYFSRLFQKEIGISPTEFRKQALGGEPEPR